LASNSREIAFFLNLSTTDFLLTETDILTGAAAKFFFAENFFFFKIAFPAPESP
jgi:hypothetical protein